MDILCSLYYLNSCQNNFIMSQEQITSFAPIKIVVNSLIAGQLLFASAVLFILKDSLVFYKEGDMFLYIVPVFLLIAIIFSFSIDKLFSYHAEPGTSLKDKLASYYSNSIVKLAPLEAAGIFSIVAMLLNESYIYLTFLIIALLVFLMIRPTKEKFVQKYKLDRDEQKQLGMR